jgi:hypothetical protein
MEKAIALQVPLVADPVAPCRLTFGDLSIAGARESERGRAHDVLFFEVRDEDAIGRVTFEGLDAMRVSRGEVAPYEDGHDFSSWVYVVQGSRWLLDRHEYEMSNYETSLLGDYQHYLFRFHDDFVEAIAQGIWIDAAPEDEYAITAPHPFAADYDFPVTRNGETAGLAWEVRVSPADSGELIERSRLCSQRLFDFHLELDGANPVTSTCWVRTRSGEVRSRLSRPWVGDYASVAGVAVLDDLLPAWERYCRDVAERRREMGK